MDGACHLVVDCGLRAILNWKEWTSTRPSQGYARRVETSIRRFIKTDGLDFL